LTEIENPGFSKEKIKELIRPILYGISGYVGGQILPAVFSNLTLGSVKLVPDVVGATTRQPLLWDRLLPNPTFSPGILYGLLWAVLPVVILFIALAVSRAWKFNWLQGWPWQPLPVPSLSSG
jgi:hypothetical protein